MSPSALLFLRCRCFVLFLCLLLFSIVGIGLSGVGEDLEELLLLVDEHFHELSLQHFEGILLLFPPLVAGLELLVQGGNGPALGLHGLEQHLVFFIEALLLARVGDVDAALGNSRLLRVFANLRLEALDLWRAGEQASRRAGRQAAASAAWN